MNEIVLFYSFKIMILNNETHNMNLNVRIKNY